MSPFRKYAIVGLAALGPAFNAAAWDLPPPVATSIVFDNNMTGQRIRGSVMPYSNCQNDVIQAFGNVGMRYGFNSTVLEAYCLDPRGQVVSSWAMARTRETMKTSHACIINTHQTVVPPQPRTVPEVEALIARTGVTCPRNKMYDLQ
jgi:hypothetical protein